MVSHQGGLSSGWYLIRAVAQQGGLSSGWSFIRTVSHYAGLSSGIAPYPYTARFIRDDPIKVNYAIVNCAAQDSVSSLTNPAGSAQ